MTEPVRDADDVLPLEHVRVLRLEPGDTLVLAYPDHLTVEMAEHLKEKLQREFPGHKAIVLDGGASFDVLRAEQSDGSE